MAPLFSEETKAVIEALLFVAKEPVSVDTLAQITGVSQDDCRQLVELLQKEYATPEKGIRIVPIAGGYQMCTPPEMAGYIEKLYRKQTSHTLSRAALETLAIVAYKQPITRAEVEQIRGVKVDGTIGTLVEKCLILEIGRKEGLGRPIIYGTTSQFLKYFGLHELQDLPDPEVFIAREAAAALDEEEESFEEEQES